LYPKRVRFPGASVAACLLALGVAAAAPAATYTVRPEVVLEQNFDDNVLSIESDAGDGSPSREISSWVSRIAPALTLERKSDTSEASVLAGFTRHETYSLSELDGTDERLAASIRQVFSPRVSASARASYYNYASYSAVEEIAAGGEPFVLFGENPEVAYRNLTTDVTYALTPRTELTAEAEWSTRDYGRADITSGLFDGSQQATSLTLSHRLGLADRVGAFVALSVSDEISSATVFPLPEVKTHDELGTAMLFWQRTWSPRWTTNLQGGARSLESEIKTERALLIFSPLCPGFPIPNACPITLTDDDSGHGFVGSASTNYKYSPLGEFSISLSRDTRTGSSSATGSSAVDANTLSVTLTQGLTPRLSLNVGGTYLSYESSFSENENVLERDSTTRQWYATVTLNWQMRKNLATYLSYYYYDLDQNRRRFGAVDPDRDYARRIFGIGLRYSFDQEL